MKPNYQAWKIDFKEFDRQANQTEQLRFLLKFAVLAPSSHNSQPWKFQITGSKISILPDFDRALPHSDQNHRQLFISLGCALENLLVAADYYGFETSWAYQETNHAIEVSLKKVRAHTGNESHLVFAIPKRHTNRNKYLEKLPDESFLEKLKSYSTLNSQISFIKNKETKNKIAEIVSEALITVMDDKLFRKELSEYLKPNITNSSIGMPASGFGIPTPVSFIAPTLIRYVNMNKLSRKQDMALLKEHSPVFGIISTSEDNIKSWIEAGELYQKIALSAEQEGLKTAPMAAAIQIGDFYKTLQRTLDITQRPQVFFRMGYSNTISAHTPRLGVTKVL